MNACSDRMKRVFDMMDCPKDPNTTGHWHNDRFPISESRCQPSVQWRERYIFFYGRDCGWLFGFGSLQRGNLRSDGLVIRYYVCASVLVSEEWIGVIHLWHEHCWEARLLILCAESISQARKRAPWWASLRNTCESWRWPDVKSRKPNIICYIIL